MINAENILFTYLKDGITKNIPNNTFKYGSVTRKRANEHKFVK